MTASLSGVSNLQNFDSLGAMAVGGRLYTYVFGTTTHKVAYTDAAGLVAHTYTSDGLGGQYLALNARGELPAPLYLATGSYDLCYKTAAGATVWTRRADPVSDVADTLRTDLASTTDVATGANIVGYNPGLAYAAGLGQFLNYEHARTGGEVTAGVTPSNYAYLEGDIRRYGASTGLGDNSTAINKALLVSASGGRAAFIPPGTWTITSTLNATLSCSMYGAGQDSILVPSGCDGITFTNQTNYAGTRFFRDFQIVASSGASYKGLVADMSAASTNRITGIAFVNLTIKNFGTAVFMRGLWNSVFRDCFLYNNWQGYYFHGQSVYNLIEGGFCQWGLTGTGTTYGVLCDSTAGESCQALRMIGFQVYNYDVNVSLGLALSTYMENCDFSVAKQYGVQITTVSGGTIVRDCWIQTNCTAIAFATVGIQIDDVGVAQPDHILIDGCTLVCDVANVGSQGIYVGLNQNAVRVTNCTIGRSSGPFAIGIQNGTFTVNGGADNFVAKGNTIYASTTAVSLGNKGTTCANNEIGPNVIQNGTALAFSNNTPAGFSYYASGSFTITLTGMASATTGTCNWYANGKNVTLQFPSSITGTSNTTAMTGTGMPTYLAPAAAATALAVPAYVRDNGVKALGLCDVATSTGVITFYTGPTLAAWTGSGTKGVNNGAITFPLS